MVQGMRCWPVMFGEFHLHSHLTILDDGRHLIIPTNIGIVQQPDGGDNRCFYEVHTHDGSGILHVESPQEQSFTLGQQFAVWGRSLSMTDVAGITGKPVRIFIKDPGADLVEFTGDPNAIVLLDRREITIQAGTPVSEIPTYNWLF